MYIKTTNLTKGNSMPSLHEIFLKNGERRIHKWVHYFDIYERHFRKYCGKAPTILEIGVQGGGSLKMWKEYFGSDAKIIGLDIQPKCKQWEEENIEIFIGSQSDSKIINEIISKYDIDVVIDDGSHVMKDIKATFDTLYNKIDSHGVYLVEDLHTCYWPNFGGGLGNENSFIEFTKKCIDELNVVHFKGDDARDPSEFTASTSSIAIYDSIVVFEKAPQGKRHAVITAPMIVQAEKITGVS